MVFASGGMVCPLSPYLILQELITSNSIQEISDKEIRQNNSNFLFLSVCLFVLNFILLLYMVFVNLTIQCAFANTQFFGCIFALAFMLFKRFQDHFLLFVH